MTNTLQIKSLIKRHKILAVAVAFAFLWGVMLPIFSQLGAANVTFFSDTLSDSDLGVVSNHTIDFSMPSGLAEGDTLTLTFEGEFNLSTSTAILGLNEFDVATGTTQLSLAYDCSGTENWSVATSGQDIIFTVCAGDGGAIEANGTTTIFIGTNASTSGTGVNQIINPVEAQSYTINTVTSTGDSGETRIAIIDDVVVTASVDTIFTFVIGGLPAGTTINGSATTTGTTTTATLIPFGELQIGIATTAAQSLSVTTNAVHGFVVTVEANQTLLSSTGADIDVFNNGTAVVTPIAWTTPLNTLGSENTYGHWGVTSEDADLNGGEFFNVVDLWAGNFVNNPREVFENSGPADGTTANQGATQVGYAVEIESFQEAAEDYTATLTYVATPTF